MSDTDYTKFTNQKVILVKTGATADAPAEEIEGIVQVGNEKGVLIRPKGRTRMELVESAQIIEVRRVVEKPVPLKRKSLKPIEYGAARSHLLERHGADLATINAMTEDEALDLHNSIDHVADDLGHIHEDKAATPAAEAIAAV